jgi:hypothetical protein
MALQRGTGYVHAVEGLSLRAQVVEVGASERETWGCSRTAVTVAVRPKPNVNENSVPAGVC